MLLSTTGISQNTSLFENNTNYVHTRTWTWPNEVRNKTLDYERAGSSQIWKPGGLVS